ncbi:MAG TPA: adenosine deaminase [Acidimicrobiia bacterium]|nr:adenosine deaminase [Acidimicrobiia bacterium]
MTAPTRAAIREAPKVVLHDHLDGGLRPATIVELAEQGGYGALPTHDPAELATWLKRGASRSDLVLYLETFEHTVGVMQTRDALARVARECAEDLAADGVVYAEVRFAPELHLQQGLSLDEVVDAVLAGFREGSAGRRITLRTLVTAMRTAARSVEIAELAIRWRDRGVVGFDIAGAEAGHPPSRHLDAFQRVLQENFHITIHAGEAFGLPSIWEAVQECGAERLGHGVRIVDDIALDGGGEPRLGRLAAFVRDRRVPLEMCPSSNVHSGAAPSIAEHPIGLLTRLRFRVTVNTDNRLMSDITMTDELTGLVEAFGIGWDVIEWWTLNAMKSAFIHYDERLELINGVIKPHYAPLKAVAGGDWVTPASA